MKVDSSSITRRCVGCLLLVFDPACIVARYAISYRRKGLGQGKVKCDVCSGRQTQLPANAAREMVQGVCY